MRNRRLLVVGVVLVVASLAVAAVGSSVRPGTSSSRETPFSREMGPMHGGPMMGWGGPTGESVPEIPGARPVEVEAVDLAFRPSRIEATATEATTIELTNTGRVLHDLSIPELGFRIVAGPGETARGSLVVEDPGEYRFLCTVPGHAEAGMAGVLVVTG